MDRRRCTKPNDPMGPKRERKTIKPVVHLPKSRILKSPDACSGATNVRTRFPPPQRAFLVSLVPARATSPPLGHRDLSCARYTRLTKLGHLCHASSERVFPA